MERSRNTQKFQHDSETINEVRPTEFAASSTAARHALNYSIQTGEEFSLEFMRDKAVPSRPYIPNATSEEQTINSNYVDLRRRRTISNARPGNGSDTRARAAVANAEKKSLAEMNSRDYLALTRTCSQVSTSDGSCRRFHHHRLYPSSEPGVKFMCSYGGKFLPRPSDDKLRYVGGDTRILRISKSMSWKELMRMATTLYNQTHIIKYQLPGEDIDALVSVLCDEDLQHMIDECTILEDSDKLTKPRLFLFSSDDNVSMHFSLGTMEGDFETHYVTAINGLDASSEVSDSQVLDGASGDEIDHQCPFFSVELDGVKPRLTAFATTEIASAPDAVRTNAPIQTNLSTDFDIHQRYKDLRNCNMHHRNAFSSNKNGILIPSSVPSEYDRLARSAPAYETSSKTTDKQFLPHWNRSEEFSNDFTRQDQNAAKKEAKPSFEDLSQDTVATKENQSRHEFSSPVQQHGASLSYLELESPYETSAANFMSPKHRLKHSETQVSSVIDIVDSGRAVAPECSNYKHNINGLSSEDSHSRISSLTYKNEMPLKQEKSAIQLSGSKDPISSQWAALDQLSYKKEEQGDVLDPLPRESMAYEFGNLVISAKPLNSNPTNTKSELREIQRSKSLAPVTLMDQFGLVSTAQTPEKSSYVHEANLEEKIVTFVSDLVSKQADSKTDGKSNEFQKKVDKSNRNYSAPSLTDGRNMSVESSSSDGKAFVPKVCYQDLLGDGSETTKSISPSSSTGIIPKQKESPTMLPDVVSSSIFKVRTYEDMSNLSTHNNQDGAVKMISNENQTSPMSMFHDEKTSNDALHERPNHAQEAGVDPLGDKVVLDLKNRQVDFSEVEDSLANVGENLRSALLEHEENVSDKKETNDHGSDAPMEVPNYLRNVQIINNDDLEELRELGAGTFGTVYHGKWRGTDVAIKRIKSSYFTGQPSQTDKMILGFWREVGILSKLHHPNVLAFYGIVKDEPGGTLATVTEYMAHGSLKHVLQCKEKHLDYRKRLLIAMDAAIGMEYLHSRNVVHFDLKCDNLLVNLKDQSRPICKVCDFGLSKMKPNTMVSGGVRGTLPWMAPELLYTCSNKVSEKIDVYSFGIVMWEILTGEEPYADMHYGEVIGGLLHNTLRPPVPASCDKDWRTLMEQCWAADPAQRPTFTQIASHLKSMYKSIQSRASSG